MKEKTVSGCTELKNIIDGIGTVQTAWGLIVTGALVLAFAFCVLTFTNRVNKATKAQIQRFQKDGKYLPSIYIELNNSMEYLRYFIFSYRWKHRIIRQYKYFRIFSGVSSFSQRSKISMAKWIFGLNPEYSFPKRNQNISQ